MSKILVNRKKILQYVDKNIGELYDKLIKIRFTYFDNENGKLYYTRFTVDNLKDVIVEVKLNYLYTIMCVQNVNVK